MRIIAILRMLALLAPTVQASNPTSELPLMVTYDGELQTTADLIIENKMNDEVIELYGVDLSAQIDISGVSPIEGDYIKITAVLDSNDITKVQTICVIFLGNMILHSIHMKSNLNHMGEMYVENTGNSLAWNTQSLIINFPTVTQVTYVPGQLNSYVDFTMNYDRNDNWAPQCDEGWRWKANYKFTLHDPNGNSNTVVAEDTLSSMSNTFGLHNGGFCEDPEPAEPEEEDPTLTVRIYAPAYPGVEYFDASATINYESFYYVAMVDARGDFYWHQDDSNYLNDYKPDCLQNVGGLCYHVVQIAWS